MTTQELISPRYKVIADYPHSLYPIGYVIHEAANLEGFTFFSTEVHKYPHIFKPLAWYEEREEKDMPAYIKIVDKETEDPEPDIVYKLGKGKDCWFNYGEDGPYHLEYKNGGGTLLGSFPDGRFLPATESEYNNQFEASGPMVE